MASELGVQTIQHTNGTDAMTIDSTGRVQVHKNYSDTSNYPSASTWSITGVPDWANKITLVTHEISQGTAGDITLRFIVGGSEVSTAVYNNNETRLSDSSTVTHYGNTESGTVATGLKVTGFNAVQNSINWMLSIYKVDTNRYVYSGPMGNDYYQYFNYLSGSIVTTNAIEGVKFTCANGVFDGGKARLFWE